MSQEDWAVLLDFLKRVTPRGFEEEQLFFDVVAKVQARVHPTGWIAHPEMIA